MIVSLALAVCAVGCAYAAVWVRGRRARYLLAGLPSYRNFPFIGGFYKFFGGGEVVLKRLTELSEMAEEKDLPFLLWAGTFPVLMFSNGDDIKEVTNAFVEKPYYYNFGRVWVGDGLLTAPGSIWKRSIKNLANAFNATIVEGYQEVFNAQAQILVNNLKGEVGKQPFDVMHKYLAQTTLEAICQTALGVPQISDSVVTTEYYLAFTRATDLLMHRGLNLMMHLDPVFHLTPSYRELKKNVAIVHNVSETIINRRIKERDENKNDRSNPNHSGQEPSSIRFKSFLDILLDLRQTDSFLTPQQIKSEVDTIIIGGQETIATTIFFIMLIVGSKTDVQDKMYAEVKKIFGESKRSVQTEDLKKMLYCEAVIYETLRLYPPAPAIMRYSDKELKLKSCTVPKNAGCGINAWGAGRSRRSWGADASEYRPERWLESDLMRTNATLFLAFSYGRRSCIGRKYAMAFMKTVLAYCIRELAFSSELEQLRLSLRLLLRAVSGHLITVQLR